MRAVLRVVLLLLCAAGSAQAADMVARSPVPAWADELAVPPLKAARLRQVQDGIYYLLLDSQVRPKGARQTFYRRSVYKVTDRNGLEEAASLDVDYDPATEHVVLHRFRILRDGKAIDALAGADVKVLEREQDLDNGILNGLKTVHLVVKDVRVGDVVDLAYSWESTASFWTGEFFGGVTTQWSVPLALMRYRLIWPSDRPLTIRNRATTLEPLLTRQGSDTVYEWRSPDAEPVPNEDGTPDWYPTYGSISLSSMRSWRDVVAWAMPLYAVRGPLPPALEEKAAAIARRFPRPEDRITEAMRLVEDDLRYVSMSIGANSYRPRSADEVWRSGYGDCKDKSALMVALLRRLGIEAYVALTDTKQGRALPELAPATNVFDHAIVEIRFRGKSYWIDATSAHEGGRFPDLAPVDYGYALPIAPGQAGLARMPPVRAGAAPSYRTVEHYALTADEHPRLTLSVVTTYLGDEADTMRNTVANKGQAKLEGDYLDFYAGLYPGLKRDAPLRVSDDREHNRLVTYEAYRLSAEALRGKLLRKFPVKASSLGDYDKVPSGERRTPYQLPHIVNREQVIELVTPGTRPPMPQSAQIDGAAFRYSLDSSRDGDTIRLDYRMAGAADVLAARDTDGVSHDADSVSDGNYWTLDLGSNAGGFIGDDEMPVHGAPFWNGFLAGAFVMLSALVLIVGTLRIRRRNVAARRVAADSGPWTNIRR